MPNLRLQSTRLDTEQFPASDPYPSLLDYLRRVLTETIARTNASHGSLEALGTCATVKPRPGPTDSTSDISSTLGSGSTGSRLGWPTRTTVEFASRYIEKFSIHYRGEQIGTLTLCFANRETQLCALQNSLALSRDLGLQLARPAIRNRVRQLLDLDLALHGNSRALLTLEADIEKVSSTPYPVVLQGSFGAPEVEIAAAIHCCGERSGQAFVVFHCACFPAAEFNERLTQAWDRAAGGSLLLCGVDLLQQEAQHQILWRLRLSRQMQDETRILVSTATSLATLEREGRFCRMLRAELDVLHVHIPVLQERRDDLRPMLEYYLAKHTRVSSKRLTLAAWQACLQHDWPENESELERLAICLTVMTESDSIDLFELQRAAPWLPIPAGAESSPEPATITLPSRFKVSFSCEFEDDLRDPVDKPIPSRRLWLESLARQLVAQDFSAIENLVPGMQRALRFLGTHFQDEISLSQLAKEAYISASHLSFLFKRDVGVPFKTILAAVRIEKARQLLLDNRQQSITEICLDAGFGDLSHFERTFKRLVGTTPRHFRRQATSLPASVSDRDLFDVNSGQTSENHLRNLNRIHPSALHFSPQV